MSNESTYVIYNFWLAIRIYNIKASVNNLLLCFPWSRSNLFLEWKCGQYHCGQHRCALGWLWKDELVPALPGARWEHCVFSMIKVFNKGQITSLALQNKTESDTWVNYSMPLTLCNIKSKLNGGKIHCFPHITHLKRHSILCSLTLLCSHHITCASTGWHWHLWETHINQRFFCTFQQSKNLKWVRFCQRCSRDPVSNGVWKELNQVGRPVVHAAYRGPLRWPTTISSCCVLHMNIVIL